MITIIYGPELRGKSHNKDALEKYYRHKNTIEGLEAWPSDDNDFNIPNDCLVLTSMTAFECVKMCHALEIKAAIISSAVANRAASKEHPMNQSDTPEQRIKNALDFLSDGVPDGDQWDIGVAP